MDKRNIRKTREGNGIYKKRKKEGKKGWKEDGVTGKRKKKQH